MRVVIADDEPLLRAGRVCAAGVELELAARSAAPAPRPRAARAVTPRADLRMVLNMGASFG